MQTKKTLARTALFVVCVILAILASILALHVANTDSTFKNTKATLLKENLDLKNRIDSLQEMLKQKSAAYDVFEKERITIQEQLDAMKRENDKTLAAYTEQLETLKRKNLGLKKRISSLEKTPLLERVKEALKEEGNESIKKLLNDTLGRMEQAKEDKVVSLEPIVVSSEVKKPAGGIVRSLDRGNSLVVISLGRKDGLKEGDRLMVLKDDQEMALVEVINARYDMAAAFVYNVQHPYTINDIQEGYPVMIQAR